MLDVFPEKDIQYICGNGFRSEYFLCHTLILIDSPESVLGRTRLLVYVISVAAI